MLDFLDVLVEDFGLDFLMVDNLWYQGKVPDDFLNELPNTAEFYYPEQAKTDKLLF